ncbi:MAG TPA: hypothetical protein VFT04_03735 [Gemmatimonadales bacterium]|nr:hypothetical protein [Gemmatimonadales bacterium]
MSDHEGEERAVVAGLFRDRDRAGEAIRELHSLGFAPEEIGAAMRDRSEQGELIPDSATRAAGGAASGAAGGGVLGGVIGMLVGAGALAIPGIGPVVAGGVLASTLGVVGGTAAAGAGIGAATGGILGALIGMGIPHEDARYFERGVREGGTLVTVHAASRGVEAREALKAHGASLGAVRFRPAPRIGEHAAGAVPLDHAIVPGTATTGVAWAGPERRLRQPGRRRSDA